MLLDRRGLSHLGEKRIELRLGDAGLRAALVGDTKLPGIELAGRKRTGKQRQARFDACNARLDGAKGIHERIHGDLPPG